MKVYGLDTAKFFKTKKIWMLARDIQILPDFTILIYAENNSPLVKLTAHIKSSI